MVVKQFEKYLFSDTYWSYGGSGEIDKASYLVIPSTGQDIERRIIIKASR
jgi:hypothetical protein